MKIECLKKELELSLYGENIKLRFPTFGEMASIEKEMDNGEDITLIIGFLTMLGMTEKQINSCYPDDIKKIMSVLSGSDEKK